MSRMNQEMLERIYGRHFIDARIRDEIEASALLQAKVKEGAALLEAYRSGSNVANNTYYPSKQRRVEQLRDMDLEILTKELFVGIAYFQREELFTSVTAQLAGRLRFSDKAEAIATVAEIVAVLCATDVFDIVKPHRDASLLLVSRIPLSEGLLRQIEDSEYLPPMVCEPEPLTGNYSSGYLTVSESLILGKGNHHNGDICLDVLNTMNRVALRVDTEFLGQVEEKPTFTISSQEQQEQWDRFRRQSYRFYALMVEQGNRFHLTHKVDKRGRIYAMGYHLTTQGTPFKKAMLELADEEVVQGVPEALQRVE